MKNFITTIIAILVTTTMLYAQSPDMMSYQAVIRDNNNDLVMNQAVGMQISILQGSSSGTAVYEETHTPTTNDNGLATIMIGNGTVVSGDITTIDWANGPYFIKTETDPTGGTNYTITGTSQLLSVPYALHAKSSGDKIWNTNANGIDYTSGDVGINTATPASALDVDGEIITRGQISINPDNDANLSYIRFNESNSRMFHRQTDSMFCIRDVNGVGINTASPSSALDVNGNIEAQGDVISDGEVIANASATNTSSYFRFDDQGGPYIYYSSTFEDVSVVGANNGLRVVGDINATGTKNFKIDHPGDPENKYLYHAAIESDKPYNKYSGNITTDENGEAVVTLPDYVEMVNKDFRYNLTVIGTFAQAIVAKEVDNNQFVIKTDKPNVKVSWELTGVRNDPYMQKHPYDAVRKKEEEAKGTYLTPEAYGESDDKKQDREKEADSKKEFKDEGSDAQEESTENSQ